MWEVTYINGTELCVVRVDNVSDIQQVIYNLPGIDMYSIIKIERLVTRTG